MMRLIARYWRIILTIGAQSMALFAMSMWIPSAEAAPELSFSGRWRIDTNSIKSNAKPTVFQVIDGGFKRDNNEIVKADGYPHRVTGDEYVDEVTISIENDHTIMETDKIRGKLAYTVEYIVSADGNTLTWHVASYTSPNGEAVRNETVMRRVGVATKGAHLISGTWQRVSIAIDANHDDIFKLDGNRFSSRTVGGGGYDAIIGGASVKIDGDNSGARVLITRPRPDLIVETDLSAGGKVEGVMSLQLMPDKNTIRVSTRYGAQKRWSSYFMRRQTE